ncbi:MAG: hypothetical protein P1P90_04745 [Patescibacteria group bacterium]|nr:hypothetical protein [Patescibacteria group bacterium]
MNFRQINFVKLFTQKLRTSRGERRNNYRETCERGEEGWLKQLRRDAPWHSPAILFQLEGSNQLDLWTNPNLAIPASADSVHWELFSNLKDFLNNHNLDASFTNIALSRGYYSTEIYNYRWGMRILAIENLGNSCYQADKIRDEVQQQSDFAVMLYELAYRYKLSTICGPTQAEPYFHGHLFILKEADVKIITLPSYHETRQERYLAQIAARQKLTITEWLKFHLIAQRLHSANMRCNYEDLIRQIRE